MSNAKDMGAFCKCANNFVTHKEHELMFCYTVQLASRWWRFCVCMEEVKERDGETEVSEVRQTSFFTDESTGMINKTHN